MKRLDQVFHRAHGTEIFRRDLAARQALDAVQQVDGVDAVDLEIVVQPGLRRHPRGIEFEHLDQGVTDERQHLFLGLRNYFSRTDIPANKQWIQEGVNGFLIPTGDPEILANKILYVYENYKELEKKAIPFNDKIIAEKALWSANMAIVESKYREFCQAK